MSPSPERPVRIGSFEATMRIEPLRWAWLALVAATALATGCRVSSGARTGSQDSPAAVRLASHAPAAPGSGASAVRAQSTAISSERHQSYPAPQLVLPAERLDERVDGAAELLRSEGCRSLFYWRLANPPADLELWAFGTAESASRALVRDAGQDRTSGTLGDEAWVSAQCVFFRRGKSYVRLIADETAPPEALVAQAERLDRALLGGEVQP